jgi:hypothetical protein|nr:MAG TPA: hypothetical protein [Caudoviricetes sp.]
MLNVLVSIIVNLMILVLVAFGSATIVIECGLEIVWIVIPLTITAIQLAKTVR